MFNRTVALRQRMSYIGGDRQTRETKNVRQGIRPQPKVREPDKGGTVPPDGPLSYGAGDALPLLWRLREGRKGLGGSKEVSSSFVAREDRKPGGGA